MCQKIKNTTIVVLIHALRLLVLPWPHAWLLAAGRMLGGWFHDLVPRDRERARRHLALAFPEKTEPELARLARRSFAGLGANALEFLRMTWWSAARVAELVERTAGREYMETALARGRGVVCLAAHVGNWEILPVYTSRQGWPTAVVAQQLYDSRLDALLNGVRTRLGVQVIRRGHVTAGIIRCLRENHLLGMLNDQDTDVDSRWAPFFGRPAKTPVGILRLARRTGAAIVPVFIARQPSGRSAITIEPEIRLPHTADEEADLDAGLKACNQAIEGFIRRYPDQWVWLHERWKHQPAADEPGRERR